MKFTGRLLNLCLYRREDKLKMQFSFYSKIYNCSCDCCILILCCVFIVCVVLCAVFRLIVVLFRVICVICVLCLIVVPLPPGRNPFAVKINNNNNNNKYWRNDVFYL
jgi:uncharacterized membrane protein